MDGLVIGYEYYTGGLVGNASGTIRGCEFDGIVRAAKDLDNDQAGQAYIGGIVGSFLLFRRWAMKKKQEHLKESPTA